ncbi:MAG: hypothetical protein AB1400_02855 [Pseudomonadota bacterium]
MASDPRHTTLNGSADYLAALNTLCSTAGHELCFFDKNFEGTGFNSELRSQLLRDFLLANPSNRLRVLAHDTRHLEQYCPRLLALQRQFGYAVHIYQTPTHFRHISEPFAVADSLHYVRRFHFDDLRGILAIDDPEEARKLHARFEELWSASHPALSGSPLGL